MHIKRNITIVDKFYIPVIVIQMSLNYDNYWNIIKNIHNLDPNTIYINVSGVSISKKNKDKIQNYIEAKFLEPHEESDIPDSKKNHRDILRIIHHHYKNGKNIVVFCYHGLNRSPGAIYYYNKRYLGNIIEYNPINPLILQLDN